MGESQSGQSQEVNERLKYSHSERERGREREASGVQGKSVFGNLRKREPEG